MLPFIVYETRWLQPAWLLTQVLRVSFTQCCSQVKTKCAGYPRHSSPSGIGPKGVCITSAICNRVERFRGVFKKFLKFNRQELPKVVPHHNEETHTFFSKLVNIFRGASEMKKLKNPIYLYIPLEKKSGNSVSKSCQKLIGIIMKETLHFFCDRLIFSGGASETKK